MKHFLESEVLIDLKSGLGTLMFHKTQEAPPWWKSKQMQNKSGTRCKRRSRQHQSRLKYAGSKILREEVNGSEGYFCNVIYPEMWSLSKIELLELFEVIGRNPRVTWNPSIWFAGLLGRWDKQLIHQSSDVPSIIFFFIKSCKILCKNPFNLFFYFFIKLKKWK